ncbi:MAG: hypothetical protein ACOC80_09265 [Petrotogales bacterium]
MLKKTLVIGLLILFIGASAVTTIGSTGEIFKATEAFETLNQGGLSDLFSMNKTSLDGENQGEEYIYYYDPDNLTWIYLWGCQEPPCYWITAIRLTEDELSEYSGWNLTKVVVALSCDNGQIEMYADLIIYGEGTPTMPGDVLYQENELYFGATGWYTLELNEYIPIKDHDEIWVAIRWEIWSDGYAYRMDEGPAVPGKGDWISGDNGTSWQELRNYGFDCNWAMGAIVEGEKTELSIINVEGPIGVKADIKNIGEVAANNLEWSMTITGGTLGMVNMSNSGTETELAPGETKPISSGLIVGLGPITINITADASTAFEVSTTKTGVILGPFVFGIK